MAAREIGIEDIWMALETFPITGLLAVGIALFGLWLDHRKQSRIDRATEASTPDRFTMPPSWPHLFGTLGVLGMSIFASGSPLTLEIHLDVVLVQRVIIVVLLWVGVAAIAARYTRYRLTPRLEGEPTALVRHDAWGSVDRFDWSELERIDLEMPKFHADFSVDTPVTFGKHRLALSFAGGRRVVVPVSLVGRGALERRLLIAATRDGVPVRKQEARGSWSLLTPEPWQRSLW